MALLSFTDIDDKIKSLSILELKQLLAQVNHDLKMGKPTIKRIKQEKAPVLSEAAECNIIAQKFTGKEYPAPIENKRIKQDIAIQRDILDYLNNGGHIITRKSRKKIIPLSVSYSNKVTL